MVIHGECARFHVETSFQAHRDFSSVYICHFCVVNMHASSIPTYLEFKCGYIRILFHLRFSLSLF